MLSDIEELRTFQRILAKGSLSGAARDLGVSLAVVSKRLASLEQRVGHRLIHRTTRQLSPTETGSVLLPLVDRALEALQAAEVQLQQGTSDPVGLLRVAAPTALGHRHIAPVLAELLEKHPRLDVELRLSDGLSDLVAARIDVAIRIGPARDSAFVMHKLTDSHRILVASPGYLERHGRPTSPRELSDHAILRMVGWDAPWPLIGPNGAIVELNLPSRLRTDNGEVVHDWALAGHGITLKSAIDVAEDVRSGLLEQVLPDWRSTDAPIYALLPSGAHVPLKVRLFLDNLEKVLRAL
jgi:LysR family transcriptional regulator, transcriptional activator for dmlA